MDSPPRHVSCPRTEAQSAFYRNKVCRSVHGGSVQDSRTQRMKRSGMRFLSFREQSSEPGPCSHIPTRRRLRLSTMSCRYCACQYESYVTLGVDLIFAMVSTAHYRRLFLNEKKRGRAWRITWRMKRPLISNMTAVAPRHGFHGCLWRHPWRRAHVRARATRDSSGLREWRKSSVLVHLRDTYPRRKKIARELKYFRLPCCRAPRHSPRGCLWRHPSEAPCPVRETATRAS